MAPPSRRPPVLMGAPTHSDEACVVQAPSGIVPPSQCRLPLDVVDDPADAGECCQLPERPDTMVGNTAQEKILLHCDSPPPWGGRGTAWLEVGQGMSQHPFSAYPREGLEPEGWKRSQSFS